MKHNFEESDNGIISSDDPNALAKLREKLAELEALQEYMKAANKVFKSAKLSRGAKIEALREMGMSDELINKRLAGDFGGRIGFASYKLTNNNGRMGQVRERIKKLEAMEGLETSEETLGEVRIVTNVEANRLQFIFPSKPADPIYRELKSHGFHWSPSEGAWQRMLPVHKYTIQRIKDLIQPKEVIVLEVSPVMRKAIKEAHVICADPGELAEDRFNEVN